jgi:transposase
MCSYMTEKEAKAVIALGDDAVLALLLDLSRRVRDLEAKLAKNSGNSSKPPSSDGFSKPTLKPMPQSQRKSSGRKQGGQKGHVGKTLLPTPTPDDVVDHLPDHCTHCQAQLPTTEPQNDYIRRQIFEIPPPQVIVTEHRAHRIVCPCCQQETRAAFPDGVDAPVQYGSRLLGLATYLHSVHLLPYSRCAQIVQDVTGAPFSAGSLHRALRVASDRLENFEQQVKQAVTSAPLLHVDETGSRVAGRLHWFHVRCTDTLTYLFHHQKRGKEAVSDLLSYSGRLVSDFFSNYVTLDCAHQFCGAHLLRELTYVEEVLKQPWAGKLKSVLETMVTACHRARERKVTKLWNAAELRNQFDRCVAEGVSQNPLPTQTPARKRVARGKVRCLLDRLRDYRDEYLPFLFDLSLPFTNNQAERDIRMLKVKGKVSNCFRTDVGADVFCRLRSYVQTCQKQGISALGSLRSVFAGAPLLPSLQAT